MWVALWIPGWENVRARLAEPALVGERARFFNRQLTGIFLQTAGI